MRSERHREQDEDVMIWGDGGELEEVFQKHILAAVTEYFMSGYWALNIERLSVVRIAPEPLGAAMSAR